MKEDSDYNASLSNWEDFIKSTVWADFKSLIEGLVLVAHITLETEIDMVKVFNSQGEVAAFRKVLQFPEIVINDMKYDSKEEEKNE